MSGSQIGWKTNRRKGVYAPPLSRTHIMRSCANQTHLASIMEHIWHNRPETPVVIDSPDLCKVEPPIVIALFWRLLRLRKGLLHSRTSIYAHISHTHDVPISRIHRPHTRIHTRSTRRRPSESEQSVSINHNFWSSTHDKLKYFEVCGINHFSLVWQRSCSRRDPTSPRKPRIQGQKSDSSDC